MNMMHGVGWRLMATWIGGLPAGCQNGCVDGPTACLLGWSDWVGMWVSIGAVGRFSCMDAGGEEVWEYAYG